MKYILLSLTFFFSLSNLNAAVYKVQKGDSLWDISSKFKVPMATLRKINDFYGEHVRIGQQLFIPDSIELYTVKEGDTYDNIAKKFQTKVKYIITLNNISENHTFPGQILKIPVENKVFQHEEIKMSVEKPINYTPIVYKVRKGDTLSDVALKYRTTVPSLRELNKKTSTQIYVGERLIVGNRSTSSISQSKGSSENNTTDKLKTTHTVLRNQNLAVIANKYNVSINDLKKWNNKRSSTLHVGEKLIVYSDKLPEKSTIVKTSESIKKPSYRVINYTVRKGDHLLLIAAKFGVKFSDLKKWNNKSNDRIYMGERIRIHIPKKINEGESVAKADNTRLITYTVKKGDTLGEIALKHKISSVQLRSWNRKSNSHIYLGEKLKIYIPYNVVTRSSSSPSKSKAPQYTASSRITGIKSNRFNDIALPVVSSQILYTRSSGRGIDIQLKSDLPLRSPTTAKVSYAGYINALKNVVILDLPDNRTIVYAGLNNLDVTKGQHVVKGQNLGVVGKYSNQDIPTLYMELRDNKKVANAFHTYKVLATKRKEKK
ncbi:MAG: LysM peptidoglycan-binding domain-containing protein [Brevinema sp.]